MLDRPDMSTNVLRLLIVLAPISIARSTTVLFGKQAHGPTAEWREKRWARILYSSTCLSTLHYADGPIRQVIGWLFHRVLAQCH